MSDLGDLKVSEAPDTIGMLKRNSADKRSISRTTEKSSCSLRLDLFSFILLISLGWENGRCVRGGGVGAISSLVS